MRRTLKILLLFLAGALPCAAQTQHDRIASRGQSTFDSIANTSTVTITGATPSVSGGNIFKTNNGGATTITNFLNGHDAQTIKVICGETNTVIANNATIEVASGSNFTCTLNASIEFTFSSGASLWIQSAGVAQSGIGIPGAPTNSLQKNNGVGGFSASGISDNGTTVSTSEAVSTTGTLTTTQLNGCQLVNANQTFAQALVAVSNPGCIQVSPGTFPVAVSATVPATVTLRHDQGGVLQVACGQKLTIAGPFQAGLTQAFSSAACSGAQSAAITAATQNPGSTVAITAASESGNTVTITTTLNPGVGNQVLIAGVTPAGYNEACWVLSSSGTNFTCYNPTSGLGAGSVFGTAGVVTNTVMITSTLNPPVNGLVQISGVTPTAYNGLFWVLSTSGSSFTVFNSQIGISAGAVFGTATIPGTAVFTLPGNEAVTKPEWFGGVADGTLTTPVAGTDNQAAFTFALNALPIFTLPAQGSYIDNTGMVSRTGRFQLSPGRYVVGQTVQLSERVKYNCPSYAGCTITLKNGTTGTNEMFVVQVATNPSGANGTFGPQFENISVDCNGGNVYGSNTQASGMFIVGAQGLATETLEIFNCGRRGLWLGPQAIGNVNSGTSINGPCDIWVTQITQGPGIQMDASVTFCGSVRIENINTNGTFLDADGDPNPGLLIGSQMSNGSSNLHIGVLTGEFDGLPLKIWSGSAIDLDSIILLSNAGGQPTAAVISHTAGGTWIGRVFSTQGSPNLFTSCVTDRTTSPTTLVSCNFQNFPLSRGYYSRGGFGNVGNFILADLTFPEISSDPGNFGVSGFDSCRGDSTAHAIKCSWNNASSLQLPQISATDTTTTHAAFATATAGVLGTRAIATGDLPTSGIPNVVYNNTTNTATAAMTLDMSAVTVANAFKVPLIAGATAGADGVVVYDSTNKNTHVRTNGADSIVGAFSAAPTTGDVVSATIASGNTLLSDTGFLATNVVRKDTTNTGAAAMTLNMSASTTANSLVAPAQAGLTSGTNGAIAYDTTNNNTHIRTNSADSIAVAEAAALAANTVPKQTDATHGLVTTSLCDEGGSEANRFTCTDSVGAKFTIVSSSVGQQTISGSDYTNATTTPSTVFSWTLPATTVAKNYRYSCNMLWESTNTTLVGPVIGLNISAAPTQITGLAWAQSTLTGTDTTGYLSNATTGSQTLITGAAAGVTNTNYKLDVWGTIEGAPTAGSTFIINAASTSGTTATLNIRRGGGCLLTASN